MAAALADADCPLFVISTVRADFLDRFESDLPRLNALRRSPGRSWPLSQLDEAGLREVIEGPARLADIDVSEVKELMVAQACDEPGALPLVENALDWLWDKCEKDPRGGKVRLSGQLFSTQGGLAGILSQNADDLLKSLGKAREQALKLLFPLVKIDAEGRRHARRHIPLAEAVEIAGGGARGRDLVNRLAGQRGASGDAKGHGPLRLITVTEEPVAGNTAQDKARWVNLIHEMLIHSKNTSAEGKPQPYWPTLWQYIEQNKAQAARREHLELLARQWKERKGLARLFGLAGWWDLVSFRGLAARGSLERSYLRWSMGWMSAITLGIVLLIGIVDESAWWAQQNGLPPGYTFIKPLWMLGYVHEPRMVEIPHGSFTMGCVAGRDDVDGRCPGDEIPSRPVTISQSFTMGKYEVTFLEYDSYVWHKKQGKANMEYPKDESWGRFNRPVINVSWQDAKAYAQWLGEETGRTCRLPSEAEWEYAARGGTEKKYGVPAPDGSDAIEGKGLANCRDCGSAWDGEKTAPAGSFPANRFGLHDLSGNVWEWVEDTYQKYPGVPTGAEVLASEESRFTRVLRGGSWFFNPVIARAAARYYYNPVNGYSYIGFRVLCSSSIE